jgi:uncharacterized OsmC-like protein
MSPPELFIASIAACIGVYVLNFANRHSIPTEGTKLSADWQIADSPSRVGAIQIDVKMPGEVGEAHLAALRRVAEQCLIHNTLQHPPDIAISVT